MAGLFVSSFGSGRPMLCLHGVESHGMRFLGLAARLNGVRVVAPDLPGHGRSPMTGPWTIERDVEDLLPVLRAFVGTDRAVVLGHSYGGLLAWELARAAPVLVAALVLVDPAIGVDVSVAETSMTYEASSVGHRWPDEESALADMVAGRPASGRWSAALDVAVAMAPDPDGWLRPVVSADAVAAAWQQMQLGLRDSAYRGPVLLIEAGRENGRFVSAAVVERLRAALGDQLEHVVLDVTHTIPSDFPDELANAVQRLVARL